MENKSRRFVVATEFGEILDLTVKLQDDGNEVLFHVMNKDYEAIGEGIVKKRDDSWPLMGHGNIWIFDGCSRGKRQDWLRSQGELVFGGTEKTDKLENDRQLGQALFKSAGFQQPVSKNFKDFDSAIKFTKSFDGRLILKQNADAPKSLNHMGKFEDGSDMLYHLEELKKSWNESQFGKIDFDLMEVVEGLEVSASAFFNGHDFLRNKKGKIIGFLTFEEKKEIDGNKGETVGEMGTTFIGCTEDNILFRNIILKPKVVEALKKLNYRGVFDINCIKTDKGIVALEPTCRFGIPTTSYTFIEGLVTPAAEIITACAKGEDMPIEIHEGIGMVMVIAAKPYPVEADVEDNATSIGQRLWILENGKSIADFTEEQRKHIHLQNFKKVDGVYKVATKNGYLLTVTARGKTVMDVRESLIKYIEDNIYVSGMKFRTDIGARIEGKSKLDKLKEEYEGKLAEAKKEKSEVVSTLKQSLRKAIYE